MTKISIYNVDTNVKGNDKWIGSDAQNYNATKNFTPTNLAEYFNHNQVIDSGNALRYTYQTLDPLEQRRFGTISFITEIGPQVNFSDITTFLLSKLTLKQNDVSEYLAFLNGSKVIISKANDTNLFGLYNITGVEVYLPEPNFFNITLTYIDGNGFIKEDNDYIISLIIDKYDQPPTKTSDLINDGEDGVHPFITAEDIPTTSGTLQEVTDNGSTTTNGITVASITAGNLVADGYNLGISDNFDGNYNFLYQPYSGLFLNDFSGNQSNLSASGLQLNSGSLSYTGPSVAWSLPDYSGTIALTSDITTPTLQEVTTEGNTTKEGIVLTDNTESGFTKIYNEIATSLSILWNNGFKQHFLNDYATTDRYVNWQDKDYDGVADITDITANNADALKRDGSNANSDVDLGSFNITSNSFIKTGGTSSEYLMADGSVTTGVSGGGLQHATALGTDTYTATITGVTSYADGDAYLVRFTNGNTTGCTLNINSLGAVSLYRNNDGPLLGGDISAGGEMICIYNSTANTFQCIGISPNSLLSYVTNADSVTITKGMPVYAFSGTGDRMTVKRALNTGDSTSAQTVGIVLSTSIAANQKGLIMMQGLLDGLSILPTSTFADGDPIYLGSTAGSITNVKPYAPNHLVYLGVVTTASNGSAGRMYVRVQNGYELDELHNVQAQSPTLKDTLWYDNSVSPAQWKTASIPTILGYIPQPSLSFTPFKWLAVNSTPHIGTLSRTAIGTAIIPGGTYDSGDVMKVFMQTSKLLSIGNVTYRLEINTTNTLSGAVQIGVFTSTTSLSYAPVQRTFTLRDNLLYGYTFGSSAITDVANVGGAQSSTTYNTANTLYLFFTVQTTNISDSATISLMTVTN